MIDSWTWSNILIATISFAWLAYRAGKVLNTPVEVLVNLLGLEVPPAPIVSLLDISSDSIAVHWKPAEQRNSVVKYVVKINGVSVGQVTSPDTSISISGLLPGLYYTVRIVAVNSTNFQASSEPIRIRTADDASKQSFSRPEDGDDTSHSNNEIDYAPSPTITAHRPASESTHRVGTAPAMTRDPSSSSQNKRTQAARKPSPATHAPEKQVSPEDGSSNTDCAETVKQLTDKLDCVRREIEEVERQEQEEYEEFRATRDNLNERKDLLRQQLKEREDESKDLKKNVTGLERQNAFAQSKKSAQEKLLQQKLGEREKFYNDIKRWDREVEEMREEAKRLILEKEEYEQNAQQKIEALKNEQDVELQRLKKIEDQIHERGTYVKSLEEEQKRLQDSPRAEGMSEQQTNDFQEQYEWQQKMMVLENHAQHLYAALREAQIQHHNAQQRFGFVNARRGSQQSGILPYASDSFPQTAETNVLKQNYEGIGDTRPLHNPFTNRTGNNSMMNFRSVSPLVTASTLLSMPDRPQNKDSASPRDIQQLTGGALTSPTADLLLPSDLLGDDPEDSSRTGFSSYSARADADSGSRPPSTNPGLLRGLSDRNASSGSDILPGLGTIPGLGSTEAVFSQGLASPRSLSNQSPSAISSPRGSIVNLHYGKNSDGQIDSDRRSIRSAGGSSRVMTGTTRFGGLFNRQRGKTVSNEEGPALGTLKSSQSQSMPRPVDNDAENQPKKSTNPASFFGQMSNAVLGRKNAAASKLGGEPETPDELQPTKSNPFGVLGSWSRSSAAQRPLSARPASTYSAELPQPSGDMPPFGWSVTENVSRSSSVRNSVVGNPWAPNLSARQSLREASTTDLLGEESQLDEEDQRLSQEDQSPLQAPIGTKPSAKQSSPPTQLNPNARTFRSRFGKDKKADKVDKGTPRTKKKEKSPAPAPAMEDAATVSTDDSSPPASRKSKDSRRALPTTPTDELTDADDRTDSPPATPSEGGAAAGQQSLASRESFMRKLTRKGSSSKFNLPSLKDRGSLFSRKSYQSEDLADEDSGASGSGSASGLTVGRGGESVTSSPQIGGGGPSTPTDKRSGGFSLSALTKRKKSGVGNATPSISETSMASETGDEVEDDDDQRLSEEVSNES